MDLLKAEIERKRKQVEKTGLVTAGKKYFKRGDLAKKQEEEYYKNKFRKHGGSNNDQPKTSEKKTRKPSVNALDEAIGGDFEKLMPTRGEVERRLRERSEPVRLFGETDMEGFQRLRKMEILAPEITSGRRNDFKVAMDKVDAAFLSEIEKSAVEGITDEPSMDKKNEVRAVDNGLTVEEIKQEACALSGRDISADKACDAMLHTFQYILKLWANDLNSREEKQKLTTKSKLDTATYNQTVTYLKPLLRKLKKRTIPDDIYEELKIITMNLMMGEYVRANDAYYMIAIGNAAWPIGVTMVGIHARTGREKIFAQHVAHVLNDEQQRKYIQGLKRLMTKLQTYVPADPSKSVEWNAIKD